MSEKDNLQPFSSQVVSRQRVADHGEVFTAQREVKAMVDLVSDEAARIDARFLEPACGTGNFLVEILSRKLNVVRARFGENKTQCRVQSLLALASLYGIDILEDNVEKCRSRLLGFFTDACKWEDGEALADQYFKSAAFILSKNIVWADALTMKLVGKEEGISFVEWAIVANKFKGRIFRYADMQQDIRADDALFHFSAHQNESGESVFITEPVSEYPLTHYLELHGLR